jgi:UDP-2,4-diacetamido-2,4,6-trideoxy-beta-L-altropyranose hydrolase
MKVVFRADASARMGTGHIIRCLTIAEALRGRGIEASFICREHPGHLIAALRAKSVPVAVLPPPEMAAALDREDYAEWLGVPEREDADQTIAALDGQRPDWLVVDSYGLGEVWERELQPQAGRLFVVDDLADRRHVCDALLDQNDAPPGTDRYRDLVPPHCRLFIGPRYALLAPIYAEIRRTLRSRDGTVRRVLVYFGGADPSNMTGQALTALSGHEFSSLAVDLVIGTNHPQRADLERRAATRPGTSVYGTRPHLADLMAAADLAVGAGGGTTWERMCVGLPSVVVSIAQNQRPTCEALAAAGLIEYLGGAESVAAARIGEGLQTLLANPARLRELSSRGRRLVDGEGASRVAGFLAGSDDGDPVRTRHALHAADARPVGFGTFSFAWIDRCRGDDVLALRNMPHVRTQMRSRDAITPADHRAFLDQYDSLDRYDFVLVDDSSARCVGVFYVTNVAGTPEIGKYIGASEYLGRGIARQATQCLLDFCRSRAGLTRLVSMTRADNARNIALNASLGFEPSGAQGDYVIMTLAL